MKTKLNSALFLYLSITIPLSICALSCKGADGPAGPSLSGDLVGYSYLYDLSGNRAADNSGITVAVEGSSTTATTTADGRWTLSGLKTGTYTIAWTKSGYGMRKSVGLQFVGGGQVYYGSISLYLIATHTATNLVATTSVVSTLKYVNLSGNFSGTTMQYMMVRFFVGTSSAVSSTPANYLYTTSSSYSSTPTTFSTSINTQSLTSAGIFSGSTIYVIAYGDSYFGSTSYIDIATGRFVYTCLNAVPSNVSTVVVP